MIYFPFLIVFVLLLCALVYMSDQRKVRFVVLTESSVFFDFAIAQILAYQSINGDRPPIGKVFFQSSRGSFWAFEYTIEFDKLFSSWIKAHEIYWDHTDNLIHAGG